MGIFDKLFGKKKEEPQTKKAEEASKTKKTLLVRKFVSPEELKKYVDSKCLKYCLFAMHERDLSRYPWIKRAIVELEGVVPIKLSEQELKQFHEMSGGASAIILPLTHSGLRVKVTYLLRLI